MDEQGYALENLAEELAGLLLKRAEMLEAAAKELVAEVTRHNIDEVLKNNKVVFLFFTADWCGPCISFMKTFKEVAAANLHPAVFYGKVDVDRSYSIADKYDVKHIPSILVFVDGKLVESIIGSMDRAKLEEKVKRYIKLAQGKQ
ncbi:thioredoxin family protein [Stetteria hydrogenophila]